MKSIGVLSGMSWESSAQSYALINWGVCACPGLHRTDAAYQTWAKRPAPVWHHGIPPSGGGGPCTKRL